MFEDTASFIPSAWSSMHSWLTPTMLFVLLNIMIGTIAITSSFATQKPTNPQKQQHQQHQQQQPQQQQFQDHPQFVRSPSMLQRLKSMNFCSYRFPEPNSAVFTQQYEPPTIVTAQYFNTHENEHQQQEQCPQQPQLGRSPSMLQRLKSINLYNYLSPEPAKPAQRTRESADSKFNYDNTPQEVQAQDEHHLQPEEAEEEYDENKEADDYIQNQDQTLEGIYSKLKGGGGGGVSRTKSDTEPASGAMLSKLPKKMKKSASSKSTFSHFREEEIVENRRPATMREGKAQEVDDEVDAKADDFINKFKRELKLQRMDSIARYKEMNSKMSGN